MPCNLWWRLASWGGFAWLLFSLRTLSLKKFDAYLLKDVKQGDYRTDYQKQSRRGVVGSRCVYVGVRPPFFSFFLSSRGLYCLGVFFLNLMNLDDTGKSSLDSVSAYVYFCLPLCYLSMIFEGVD